MGGLITVGAAAYLGYVDARDKNIPLGLALSGLIVTGLAVTPIAIVATGKSDHDDVWDLYSVVFGAVLLMAFFWPQQAFFLRGIQRISGFIFFPRSRLWLPAMGVLFIGAGVYGLVSEIAV